MLPRTVCVHMCEYLVLHNMFLRVLSCAQEYEEILVPASKPPAFKEGERLVSISELPEWMHPAFEGMKELNRIQSRVSQTALYTSENILMCAPTGAGKTNVAMLTILQEVGFPLGPT